MCSDGTDLQLAQIIPMYNEETGEEPAIVKASFADPYLLLVRNDGSVMVHVCDEQTLEMEEVVLRSEHLRVSSIQNILYIGCMG